MRADFDSNQMERDGRARGLSFCARLLMLATRNSGEQPAQAREIAPGAKISPSLQPLIH